MRSDNFVTESKIKAKVVSTLRKLGITVFSTSNRHRTANTKACPDLFVHIGKKYWLAIEMKTKSGRLTDEQKLYLDKVYVCRSVEDVINIINQHKKI